MNMLRYAFATLFAACLVGAAGAATNAIPWRVPAYTLTARAMSVRQALETFGVAQGIPVIMSSAVDGTVSGNFKDVPAASFIDRLATISNLIWYYDGAVLYVYGASESVTTLIDLKYMKSSELAALLAEFGVQDARYPIKEAQNGELIMVSGPPRYVQLVSELIARADRLREQRTFNEVDVRLFPLTYTWADDVTITVSTPESSLTIKGIASLLKDLAKTDASEQAVSGTNRLDKTEAYNETLMNRVKPVIQAENRSNAVLVRDSVMRMKTYEKLIRQLDKPAKLVEITITTIELTKEDAFEWQTSLSVSGSRARESETHGAGAGSNIDNLQQVGELAGKGLAGAYSYVGKDVAIDASVSALKSDGKTRSISRTALLTFNNFAASITDSQSYNARVTGEKVATLQSVSAGTTFRMKPRAVKMDPTNAVHDVWLVLEIQDGGFQSTKVDGMPMTRNTTLTTQAMLKEGESLVLAGYLRDVEGDSGWGIPWLRDIPIIGWLFGGQTDTKESVQRMFVLTPRVIIATPDTTLDQTLHLRDTTEGEFLSERMEHADDLRKIRRQDIREKRAISKEKADEKFLRRQSEIEHDATDRRLERDKRDAAFAHRMQKREALQDKKREDWERSKD